MSGDGLHPLSRLIWGEYRFRIVGQEDDRLDLQCSDNTKERRQLSLSELETHVAAKTIFIEPAYFARNGKAASPDDPVALLAADDTDGSDFFIRLPLKHQLTALDDLEWVEALDRDYKAGKVVLYARKDGQLVLPNGKVPLNVWIAANTARIREACRPWRFARLTGKLDERAPKKRRKGQDTGEVDPPSVSQLKSNYHRFRSPGFHIHQFAPKYPNCIKGGKRLKPEIAAISERVIRDHHASNRRMEVSVVRPLIGAELTKFGFPNTPPCHEALKNIISQMSEGRIIAAQFGFKRAREVKGTNSRGPRPNRMGELVLMDCWMMDIVLILKRTGVWIALTRAQKRAWGERSRVWICVAVDVATRMILGLAFGLSESPALSVRVLRMVLSDKTDLAEACGGNAMPAPGLTPEALYLDSGIAFTHPIFKIPALALIGRVTIGKVGEPWRRGIIERLFSRTKDQHLPYYSGLTFGNPVAKGDHDAEADASATLEIFAKQTFRFYHDVYHLQKHDGLDQQPPLNRAIELLNDMGIKDPPSPERIRVHLGVEVSRPLTEAGITYAGIPYQTAWLANEFFDGETGQLRIKVDPCDLGCISVLWNNEWETVPGPFQMNGIGLTAWRKTTRDLKRRYGEQAAVNFPVVAEALLDFCSSGAKARAEANLIDTNYDSDFVRLAAQNCALHVIFRPSPLGPLAPRSITQGAFGAGYAVTGPEGSVPEEEDRETSETRRLDPRAASVESEDADGVGDNDATQDGAELQLPRQRSRSALPKFTSIEEMKLRRERGE